MQQIQSTDPLGGKNWRLGSKTDFIAFDYSVLDTGRIKLHSVLHCDAEDRYEDFLVEVAGRDEAHRAALSMVWDAEDYLEEATGAAPEPDTEQDFLDHLKQTMGVGLH